MRIIETGALAQSILSSVGRVMSCPAQIIAGGPIPEAERYVASQAERFGVPDYRVAPVQSASLGRFLVPALGVAAFAVLAGPLACFVVHTSCLLGS